MSTNSIKLQDQTGTPYGVQRVSTSGPGENVPVFALTDEDGTLIDASNPLPIYAINTEQTEGSRTSSHVSDDLAIGLLADMLLELKKMVFHISLMTDEVIENQEIE